ncbi:hypothetical protein BC834DRAFT_847640 [Gloeopeniophorella convolvens]|nr:hypothetical protein BC834DRAFT_847640 [Gloeopeniophorella convolvens]
MTQYLHPLSIPSRRSTTSDESPYTQSPTSISCSSSPASQCSRTTIPRSPHYLHVPGLPTQWNIKDADNADRLANAPASRVAAFITSISGLERTSDISPLCSDRNIRLPAYVYSHADRERDREAFRRGSPRDAFGPRVASTSKKSD